MLGQFAETEDAQTANFTAWSCALAADAVGDFSLPIALAERAVELDPNNDFHLKNLGAILYRAGRIDELLPSSMKRMSFRAIRGMAATAPLPTRGTS